MSVELATAYVQIIPTTRGIQGRLSRDLSGPLGRAGDQGGEEAGQRFARKFAFASKVGLAGVAVGIAAVFKTGFDEAKDASKGTAQLQAGIKSTGNAANVSVDGLNNLASSIQGYSGQTDDSVVAAEQLLLTFTNIKNAGPDKIFDQATVAAADMAARMGGDASSNAIRLGKALNDPVKGITALTKVGVSFTDAQKAQVTALVKTGDTVGAQKVILGELNKEFGGSAKAAGKSLPGQLAIAKRAFEDVSQQVVTGLLPVLTKVLSFIQKKVIPGIKVLVDWIQAHWPAIKDVIVSTWQQYIQPVFAAIASFITTKVIPAIQAVVAFVVAHWPQIKDAFVKAWDLIRPTLEAFGKLLQTVWDSVIKPFVAWVQAHWSQISAVIKVVFVAVAVAAAVVVVALRVAFTTIGVIIRLLAAEFRFLYTVASTIFRAIGTVVRTIGTAFSDAYRTAKRWIGNIVTAVSELPGKIAGFAGKMVRAGTDLMIGVFDGIKSAVSHAGGFIASLGKDIVNAVIDGLNAILPHKLHIHIPIPAAPDVNLNIPLIPNIPHLAKGGRVKAGESYVVGDGGRPEVFTPDRNGRVHPSIAAWQAGEVGGGSQTINLVVDGRVLASVVADRQLTNARRA